MKRKKNMEKIFDQQKAEEELAKGYVHAEKLLNDNDKIERLLQRMEKKLKVIPLAGNALSKLPVMISLVKSFIKKQYTDAPIGSIVAIVSAITYTVSPIDAIPDFIPFAGQIDDALVVLACWKLVESDIQDYIKWREENDMVLDI